MMYTAEEVCMFWVLQFLWSEVIYNPIHPNSRQCMAILSSIIHP